MDDTPTLNDRVASEIRAWIGRRQTTGRKVAAKIGKSQTWVSTRTRGETEIALNDLELFARALDVPVTDLLATRDSARAADKAYSAPVPARSTAGIGRPRHMPVRCATRPGPTGQAATGQPAHSGRDDRRPVIQAWTHDGVAA